MFCVISYNYELYGIQKNVHDSIISVMSHHAPLDISREILTFYIAKHATIQVQHSHESERTHCTDIASCIKLEY